MHLDRKSGGDAVSHKQSGCGFLSENGTSKVTGAGLRGMVDLLRAGVRSGGVKDPTGVSGNVNQFVDLVDWPTALLCRNIRGRSLKTKRSRRIEIFLLQSSRDNMSSAYGPRYGMPGRDLECS